MAGMKLTVLELGPKWDDVEVEVDIDSNDVAKVWTIAIADSITRIRRSKKMTLMDLAERSGRSYKYISQVECGYNGVLMTTLVILARGLGVKPSEIVRMAEKNIESARLREKKERREIKK